MSRENDGFEYRRELLERILRPIYRVINSVVVWHRLPTLLAAINLSVFRDWLRQFNLHHTGYGVPTASPWVPGNERFRSADGSYNSLDHPRMGMAGARFGRNVPLSEAVPDTGLDLLDPSPRVISSEILQRRKFIPATTLNLLAAAWIQFETHNWFAHGPGIDDDPFKIPLMPGDDWPKAVNGCMHIRRSRPDDTPREPWLGATPTFRNQNSHWWDAGNIYSSSAARQRELRSFEGGKIKLENGRLPDDPTHPGVDFTGFNDNWWVGLSLLHHLFVFEHNTICDGLAKRYPSWNDEELFQHARLINAALIAKIHTVEWTPGILGHPALDFGMHANWSGLPFRVLRAVLGKDSEVGHGIPGTHADQHSAPYALTEEFVSVYRLHPLIPDDLVVRSLNGKAEQTYDFLFVQGAHTRGLVDRHGLTDLLYSFGTANPGAITAGNYPNFLRRLEKLGEPLMDLAAVDIMRDRERGVPRYNRFRELLGRGRVKSFDEITSNRELAAKLRDVYRNDIDRVDLLVGMQSEDLPKGFGFSDTAFRVFIMMASRRLKSDRFFTEDYRPEIYTDFGMDWIENNGMKSVLLRHYPELGPAVEGVANAFAPWNRL
jgi:Animal haem peroxidase